MNLSLWIAFLVSALSTFLVMPWLLRFCKRRGLYDMPNERKVHHNRIPRLGGLLFLPCATLGMVATLLLMILREEEMPMFSVSTYLIVSGTFLIYLIGLLDDILGLNAKVKFMVQLCAALFFPVCNLYINNLYGFMGITTLPVWLAYPLTIFLSLLIVNSINLIDGIDGLASGLSIFALGAFTVYFVLADSLSYAVFSMAMLGTVLAFFYFNLFGKVEKGTKTFMGDTGSLILGYSLSYLAIKLTMINDAVMPYRPEAFLLTFSLLIVPTFDLVRVALMRIAKGKSMFFADKTHIHHKFLAAGFTMHQSLCMILLLQLVLAGLNIALFSCCSVQITYIFVLDVLLFTGVQLWLNARMKRVV